MTGHGRNRHALPGTEVQLAVISQIDGKASVDDDEELIGRGMIVPAIRFIEHGQPKTAIIDTTDDHVPVRLRNGCALCCQIDYMQRGISHRPPAIRPTSSRGGWTYPIEDLDYVTPGNARSVHHGYS